MQSSEPGLDGFSLSFFDSMILEQEGPDEHENSLIFGRNILRIIMSGWNEKWTDLISWKTFKSVFFTHDPALTKGFRQAFQEGFIHVFLQLENSILTPAEHQQAQRYINNCLMFLPFADLTPYESVGVPQWVCNRWKLIDYKVVPIELTPTRGFEKIFIEEKDRVFAFGLEPIQDTQAPPHLIFMGTSYPAGQGFFSSIHTDFEAFETVGKRLYRSGRPNLARWLQSQTQKVHVCGTSLGGALSFLLAIDQGDKLSRVDALNPPGLYQPLFRKSQFDHWDKLTEKPDVYIQRQGNDLASKLGVWKPEWHLLHIIPSSENKRFNWFTDHAFNYAGLPGNQLININAGQDNKDRLVGSFIFYTVLSSAIYIGFMIPYRYIVQPIYRFITNNLLAFTLMMPFIITQLHMVPVVLGLIMPPIVVSISMLAAILFSTYVGYKMALLLPILRGTNQIEPLECHRPELPRNPSMDIYANRTEAEFTYKEINVYYLVMPRKCQEAEYKQQPISKFFRADGVIKSKDQILSECREPSRQENKVICSATKAKIYEMKKTLQLVNRFGFHTEALKDALAENRQAYLLGKVPKKAEQR